MPVSISSLNKPTKNFYEPNQIMDDIVKRVGITSASLGFLKEKKFEYILCVMKKLRTRHQFALKVPNGLNLKLNC